VQDFRHHARMNVPAGYVKVMFQLPPEGNGWPPASSEGLWAQRVGENVYRVHNIPWFVRDLAREDLVRALPGAGGVLWAVERVAWSGALTLRVSPFKQGPLRGDCRAVLDAFAPLGVVGEGFDEKLGIVALDVPAGVSLRPVWDLLVNGCNRGWWGFEEGCVSAEWRALNGVTG
jgi:hypothetical protein